ncbi:molybdate ABC transporter permease subunit [Litchfieldia alkalitelluris]|uniref:molybdate ABC transporter permease subunit n=1 Tax=Litchfieldia alkalitelluris TaxID=304268 RepID=UPI0009982980|nr:molybdate ABC transporter permease subunit [Litchfieldia alkalitelluris]
MEELFWSPIKLSISIALISGLIVLCSGIIIARLMVVKNFKGKIIVETVLMLPIVLPPTVIGFFLIVIFGNNGPIGRLILALFDQSLMFTWGAAVIASTVVAFPLMYQTAKAGFHSIDKAIEEASAVDGATGVQTFFFISIPLALKTIIAGFVLSFARALGEFGATLMFAGIIPGKTLTLPTGIYVAIDSGNMTLAWAWVITTVIISFIMLLITYLIK